VSDLAPLGIAIGSCCPDVHDEAYLRTVNASRFAQQERARAGKKTSVIRDVAVINAVEISSGDARNP
jgi:hypothetical protein